MKNWRQTFTSLVMNTTPDEKFDPKELQMGIESEKEHGVTPEEAKSIAKDHLKENSAYYSKLKQYVETKSSSKLSQGSELKYSMGNPLYLHCPGCGYQAPEEEFLEEEEEDFTSYDRPFFDDYQEEDMVICPQCGRPFEKEAGDPFSSGEEF